MTIVLKRGSGILDTRAEVVEAVKDLQLMLGFDPEDIDGKFGELTEAAVKAYQREHGLTPDGIVGPVTWGMLKKGDAPPEDEMLPGFRGDLRKIHAWEGHAGKPYLPMNKNGDVIGNSGLTLDPGVDLGHVDKELFQKVYGSIYTRDQMALLTRFLGLTRDKAKDLYFKLKSELFKLRITREQAITAFPIVASPYWDKICKKYPELTDTCVPPAVHTVYLSLAYNRGPNNPAIARLYPFLKTGDWTGMAKIVFAMQEDHADPGLRRRRREEASLIDPKVAEASL